MKKRDILFVYPNIHNPIYKEFDLEKSFIYKIISGMVPFSKSLTFPILAGVTPQNYNIDIFEGDMKTIDFNKGYDVVGITNTTASAYLSYEIADEFRKRGVHVALGGYHASALPEEAKQHADTVFIGEAEETWPQFLKDFEKNKAKSFYEIQCPLTADKIPFQKCVSKDSAFVIQATRGCPNRCIFCSISNMKFRYLFKRRKIEDVIKEIKSYSVKSFAFFDDSLTIDPEYTKKLFKEVAKLNKRFIAYGNINVLGKDEELLKLAQDAGCSGWMVGFESVSKKSLKSIGKKTNIVETYKTHVKKIHEYGMSIIGFFVFGFDYDTIDIFDDTTEMIDHCEIDAPLPFILTPFPGTPLFDQLDSQGRIITKDWYKYNLGNVVFQPKNLTPEELLNNSIETHKEWYKISNNIRRILRSLRYGMHNCIITTVNNLFTKFPR